jgi:large subunit ribosomal protein L9
VLNAPIKTIGQYKVPLSLHPDVESIVTVIVARSEGEAERVARGEDVTIRRDQAEEDAEAALAAAEKFFEPEAAKALRGDEEPEAEAEVKADEAADQNKTAKAPKSKKKNAEQTEASE